MSDWRHIDTPFWLGLMLLVAVGAVSVWVVGRNIEKPDTGGVPVRLTQGDAPSAQSRVNDSGPSASATERISSAPDQSARAKIERPAVGVAADDSSAREEPDDPPVDEEEAALRALKTMHAEQMAAFRAMSLRKDAVAPGPGVDLDGSPSLEMIRAMHARQMSDYMGQKDPNLIALPATAPDSVPMTQAELTALHKRQAIQYQSSEAFAPVASTDITSEDEAQLLSDLRNLQEQQQTQSQQGPPVAVNPDDADRSIRESRPEEGVEGHGP